VIHIPLGVLALFMLFLFLLAGMAYEAYIRPKHLMGWPRLNKRKHKC
jgi:hypothetical protein